MVVAAFVVTVLGLIASLVINALQYGWRQQDRRERALEKAEQARREEEKIAEQRRKEEAPPEFFNLDGNPGPIKITGIQHSVQGPFMDVWGNVTIVNPTNSPMKMFLLRLVLGGEECPIHNFFFRLKSDPRERFERISLRGNDKEDYEVHFLFPENNYPTQPPRDGEAWFSSTNRAAEFSVKIRCP